MDKNYYDILEINKNASQEIIDKAYKTLVKKYHPDLQEDNLKSIYEAKIKQINEAYSVLSDPEKRKNYDLYIKNNEVSEEDFNNLKNENINLKNEIDYLKNNNNFEHHEYDYTDKNNIQNNDLNNTADYIKNTVYNAIHQAYYDGYNQSLRNNYYRNNYYYKNRFKKKFKDFLAFILTIFLFILLGFILWHIPFTKNYLIRLYNENGVFYFIINLFFNIFNIKK